MKQLLRNVKIIGTGSYVPETIYTNKHLATLVPTTEQWIKENLGIVASGGELQGAAAGYPYRGAPRPRRVEKSEALEGSH